MWCLHITPSSNGGNFLSLKGLLHVHVTSSLKIRHGTTLAIATKPKKFCWLIGTMFKELTLIFIVKFKMFLVYIRVFFDFRL
jgi:hypothetical protein